MNKDNASSTQYNKLFILGARDSSEDEFKSHFSQFGTITKVWKVKNKADGTDRGIVYVLFDKVSSAAKAYDEMDGKTLPGKSRILRVLFSQDRDKKTEENIKLDRVYIKNPQKQTEEEIRNIFSEYGNITRVHISKDRNTGEVKDYAFISYDSCYPAALAVENAPEEYKANFADKPSKSKQQKEQGARDFQSSGMQQMMSSGKRQFQSSYEISNPTLPMSDHGPPVKKPFQQSGPFGQLDQYPHNGNCVLEVSIPQQVPQDAISHLFSIIPTLESCSLDSNTGYHKVAYGAPQCAAYAKDKLDGFQYLPGLFFHVRYAELHMDELARNIGELAKQGNQSADTIQSLVKNMQTAAAVLKEAGFGKILSMNDGQSQQRTANTVQHPHTMNPYEAVNVDSGYGVGTMSSFGTGSSLLANEPKYPVKYIDIPLPACKPLHPRCDNEVRLFVVSQPNPVYVSVLKDCFCRFGNFVNFDYLKDKNYGYAYFASPESAQAVIDTLHCRVINGQTLRIMKAKPKESRGGASQQSSNQSLNMSGESGSNNGQHTGLDETAGTYDIPDGYSDHTTDGGSSDTQWTYTHYTDIPLPHPQPMTKTAECVKRLFFACTPTALARDLLKDIFCRFGNLIYVGYVKSKGVEQNYGFAKFSSESSADNAIAVLHEQKFAGSILKVHIARPKDAEADKQE